MNPAIVVVGYNRPQSLRRILSSLSAGIYDDPVTLIISIDYGGDHAVHNIAEAFSWPHGVKRVFARSEHLGLRSHLMSCGDLALEYGSIILLEDDLYVAPLFYRYVQAALQKYRDNSSVCGISLYAQTYIESSEQGFRPLHLGDDAYLMQIPSSWGECFTADHWQGFRCWLSEGGNEKCVGVPWNVEGWSHWSWKQRFFCYMVDRDLYFVYPYQGLSTNFSDPGTHHTVRSTHLQSPLRMHDGFRFHESGGPPVIYDAYGELSPECLYRLVPSLKDYDMEIDLYGMKDLNRVTKPYILTSKSGKNPVRTFGRDLKPQELNIILQTEGRCFSLYRTENCDHTLTWPTKESVSYYFDIPVLSMTNLYETWKCDIPPGYFEKIAREQKRQTT